MVRAHAKNTPACCWRHRDQHSDTPQGAHGGDTAGHHCGTKPPGAAELSSIWFALAGMEGVKLGGNQGPAERHKALGVFLSDGLCEGGQVSVLVVRAEMGFGV